MNKFDKIINNILYIIYIILPIYLVGLLFIYYISGDVPTNLNILSTIILIYLYERIKYGK